MAYDLVLFAIAALLGIASAVLVFMLKDVLHSVIALTFLFIANSAIFLILGQPFLALLQLFIMVGGVSTYAFVGVASSGYAKFKHTNLTLFALFAIVIFAVLAYKGAPPNAIVQQQNMLSTNYLSQALASNVGLLYIMAIMLFGIALGSILLMKKMGAYK
jgi:NADH:ubiquinone oxidoreductase subunit 6 (subunit J)